MGLSSLRYFYLAYFSKPKCDRALYRAVCALPARRILEIGIGSADRTMRLVQLARRGAGAEPVRYVAIDLFEGRGPQQPKGLSLKETHRMLAPAGIQVQLLPGEAAATVARAANALAQLDLIVISAGYDAAALGDSWFYFPRMMHSRTRVYLESRTAEGMPQLQLLAPDQVERLAAAARPRRAA